MRFRTPFRGALCVLVCLLATASLASAATIAVPAGGNLQAAIDAAKPGDVITLEPGATYVGNFWLRNKGAINDYITLRSAAPDSQLPLPGSRMTPAYAALLPKIKSPNSMPALRTSTGANHWKLLFLEFLANYRGYGEVISLGQNDSTQTMATQVPYELVVDRIYLHGDPLFGQKRGIGLQSRDTWIVNSYLSDCKAIGQDAQAIAGFNGPGNYLIENNYLEGAGENFMLGGADPMILDLVTTNVTFRHNHLFKPLSWRDPIVATPTAVSAQPVAGGGSLAAGTYGYRVAARRTSNQGNKATSAASVEVSATIAAGTTGAVRVSWTPVADAEEYLVYGRTSGAQTTYWTTTVPYITDSGVDGTATGTPSSIEKPTYGGTRWTVKNIFELKSAQDVLVEGNVFENLWLADQPGYPIVFTPRNQSGTAPWVVVQNVNFRYNLVRHTAGGVNVLGTDNNNPSRRTNHITFSHNLFDDMTAASWGSGSRPFQLGDGPEDLTIENNTVITTDSTVLYFYGGSTTAPTLIPRAKFVNNMSAHNTYGIFGLAGMGLASLNLQMPDAVVSGNVLAGGSASKYPTGNHFPTVTAWKDGFVDYLRGNYRLKPGSPYAGLGADIDTVETHAAMALSGIITPSKEIDPVRIITPTVLPGAVMNQAYSQALECAGGTQPCGWRVLDGSLPAGIGFDPLLALVNGAPTAIETASMTIEAYDPANQANRASARFELTVQAPPLVVGMLAAPAAQVGADFAMMATVTGAVGSTSWSRVQGDLPPGLALDAFSGAIRGVPTAWGTFTSVIEAHDSWGEGRSDAKPLTITVRPAALSIDPMGANAVYGVPFMALLSARGGSGSITWSVDSGQLPGGITLDARGTLSGTPAALGTFLVAVRAQDVNWPDNFARGSLSITVDPPMFAVTVPASPDAFVGQPYTLTATASGNVGTVSWRVASGTLPAGLSLDAASGTISGTPTASGTAEVVVQATDNGTGRVDSKPLTIAVAPAGARREVVLYAGNATVVKGTWSIVADASAAAGKRVWNKDNAAPKLPAALASPANYFELSFNAEAGVAYHLWLRGKADANSWANDSVYVQFSGSVNGVGTAVNRIGTTSAAAVSIEEGTNAGLSGWGWADDSYGGFGAPMYFATTGPQTVRIQVREDGLSLDQIVLSTDRFAVKAPGAARNDTTILSTVPPEPTITIVASLADATYGAPYAAALSATGSTGSTVWSVLSGQLPAGMTLDASGALKGTPASLGDFSFTVQAQDTDWRANAAAALIALKVVPPPFGVNPPPASPAAMVGQPYTVGFTASGNVGHVVWTIASGELPAGLTLDAAAGTISGVPAMWGMFAVDVQGTDSLGRAGVATLSIVASPTPLAIATTAVAPAAYKSSYSAALIASGGTGALSWSVAGTLPAGITLDGASGVLSGTPTQVGTFVFDVRAVDTKWEGDTDTNTITLVVQPPVFSAAVAPVSVSGRVGVALQPLAGSASGNVGDVRWSLAAGNLPAGVALDAVSGRISGTPTAFGRFNADVKAEDSWGAARFAVSSVAVEVAPTALSVNAATLPPASVGKAYNYTVAATGGTGTTTWRVSGGALPAGVALGANGAFTGTPTAAGAFTFTVEAADAGWAGNVATKALTLTVGVREVVLYAAAASRVSGAWSAVADPTAAGGARLANPDAAAAKLTAPLANPANYFEVTFQAEAGVAYHLWLRGKADKNAWANDSVYVQFSGSVDAAGAPINRIGTTGAATVSIEDGTNAGLSGWGWADDFYGGFGSTTYFTTTGTQTIRIQVREDGVSLDQIVLSADKYATVAPGATKNDTVILAR